MAHNRKFEPWDSLDMTQKCERVILLHGLVSIQGVRSGAIGRYYHAAHRQFIKELEDIELDNCCQSGL